MDRNQRSRQQKSAAVPPRAPRDRTMKSRLGLTKRQPEPPAARRPAPARPPAPQNPQKSGYRPGGRTHPPRRVTHAEMLRRRRRRALLGMLLVAAVLVVGVVLSVNLLFKVADFRLENTDGTTPANTGIYTEEQIIELLGVQPGDNLFGFSTREKTQQLLSSLPYLDVAEVAVQAPNTVVIKVQPATERYALELGGQWLVLSSALKVLRTETARPDGLILLEATPADGQATVPGSFLQLQSEGSAQGATGETARATAGQVLDTLAQQLEESALLDKTTSITLTDLSELHFLYDDRITVQLGTANDLDYKIRFAAQVILDVAGSGLSATDRGTLDASNQYADGTPYLSFNSTAPTPTPAPPPSPEGEGSADPAASADPAEPEI